MCSNLLNTPNILNFWGRKHELNFIHGSGCSVVVWTVPYVPLSLLLQKSCATLFWHATIWLNSLLLCKSGKALLCCHSWEIKVQRVPLHTCGEQSGLWVIATNSKRQQEIRKIYFSIHFCRNVHNSAPNSLHLDERVCAYQFPLKQKSLEFT